MFAMLGIIIINANNSPIAGSFTGSFLGNFLVFLAMLPEALYSIISKYLGRKINPLTGAMVVNVLCFILFLPLMLYGLQAQALSQYLLFDWIIVFLGGIASVLFYWCWPQGLLTIPASTAALFGGLMPVATSLGAVFCLNEHFGLQDGLGLILVLCSIALGAFARFPSHVNKAISTSITSIEP